MSHVRQSFAAVLMVAVSLVIGMVSAEAEYPDRNITLVMPFGVHAQTTLRPISDAMSKRLGVPVTVILRPGAGGTIGTLDVINNAKPDGYTLLYVTAPNMVMASRKVPPYDPIEQLSFVGFVHLEAPAVIISHEFRTIDELLAAEKAGKLLNWSSTLNSTGYVAALQFNKIKKINAQFVPIAQGPEILTGLLNGSLQFASVLASVTNGRQYGEDKYKIHILAQFGAKRSSYFPDTPTMSELGASEKEGFKDMTQIIGALAAPKGTPEPILVKLRSVIADVQSDPEVQRQMSRVLTSPLRGGASELKKWIIDSNRTWNEIYDQEKLVRQ